MTGVLSVGERRVRPMEAEDISRVQAVALAAGEMFRSVPDPRISKCTDHPPMPASALRTFIDAGMAWVATAEGEVVGFLSARVVDGCAHVEEMSVDPRYGRRGLATSLLAAVTEWANEHEKAAVTLTTFRDVPWNRPFYERRGFRVLEGDELPAAFDDLLDEEDHEYGLLRELRVVMRRDLGPVLSVRDATADDLPDIARLFNVLIPTTTVGYRDHTADEAEMSDWWALQEEQQNPVLVADIDGEVVGYVTWTWFRGWTRFPGYRHTRELTIHVDERFQSRGIGRVLIDALVDAARTSDVHVLVSAIDSANEGSIEFHRRLGFTEVGRMPEVGRKFERWLDLVLMQRVID